MGALPIRGMMHPAANKSIKNTQKTHKNQLPQQSHAQPTQHLTFRNRSLIITAHAAWTLLHVALVFLGWLCCVKTLIFQPCRQRRLQSLRWKRRSRKRRSWRRRKTWRSPLRHRVRIQWGEVNLAAQCVIKPKRTHWEDCLDPRSQEKEWEENIFFWIYAFHLS